MAAQKAKDIECLIRGALKQYKQADAIATDLNQSNNIKIHRNKMADTTQQHEYVEDCMVEANFLDTVQCSTQGIGETASD